MIRPWRRQYRPLRVAIVLIVIALIVIKLSLSTVSYMLADQILANVPTMEEGEPEYPQTPYFSASSSAHIKPVGGGGLGISCSVPAFVISQVFDRSENEATIDLQMRQACAFHDYCYRHGHATYNYTQLDCDSMLQQHSFRLCRFNTDAGSKLQKLCQTRARLIVLGVRAGGSNSFRKSNSSTFEFDPYPVSSTGYTVHRIADASPQAVARGAVGKSIYAFDITQAGMIVSEIGRLANSQLQLMASFTLNGRHGRIMTAPMIMKSSHGEDVFLWWQRNSLSSTGGRFFAIIPSRAWGADWEHFSDRSLPPSFKAGAIRRRNTCSQDPWHSIPVKDSSAWAQTQELDCYLSEHHPLSVELNVDVPPSVVLFGLRTISCKKNGTVHCYLHMRLTFNGNHIVLSNWDGAGLESMRARTGLFDDGGEPMEQDRYRSFVSPPEFEDGATPILHFYKRGDALGNGAAKELIVRRFGTWLSNEPPHERKPAHLSHLPYTGASYGRVVLEDLQEADEPHMFFSQNGLSHYVTLTRIDPSWPHRWQDDESKTTRMKIKLWRMPPPRQEGFEKEVTDRRLLFSQPPLYKRVVPANTLGPCEGQKNTIPIPDRPVLPIQLKNGNIALVFWSSQLQPDLTGRLAQVMHVEGTSIDIMHNCFASTRKLTWAALTESPSMEHSSRHLAVAAYLDSDDALDLVLIDKKKPTASISIYDILTKLGLN